MAAAAWEDLDAFFQVDDFAAPVTLRTAAGVREIVALFDDPFADAERGEYEFDTAMPTLTCRDADVAGVARGDRAEVAGLSYDILSAPHYDGTGVAKLMLAPA